MDNQIFVSYKRADKEKVFPIKDYLEKKTGLQFWVDLDGIESDAAFKHVIIKAIKQSKVFLFFYSKTHLGIEDYEKDWTMKELNFAAKNSQRRIVFINIDGTALTDELEFDYGGKQQVDARDQSRLDRLASDMIHWLKKFPRNHETYAGSKIKEGQKVMAEGEVKVDNPNDSHTTSSSPSSDSLSSEECFDSEKHDQNYAITFDFKGNKVLMILSDDKTYYIGNIYAGKDDLSWINNKWTKTMGAGALIASSFLMSSFIIAFIAAIFGGFTLWSGKKKKVDESICDELSQMSGYKFHVPLKEELSGVKEDQQKFCVVLRKNENPTLFGE